MRHHFCDVNEHMKVSLILSNFVRRYVYVLFLVSMFLSFEACGPKFESEEACQFVQNGIGQRVSWNSALPVKVFIHESVPREYYSSVESALRRWDSALGSRPLFVLGGVVNHGDAPVQDGASVIYWRESWLGGQVGEQARTTVFWEGSQIQEADIQFNARDFEFFSGDQVINGAVDFESLLVHELGHLLGLSHSAKDRSVMVTRLSSGVLRRVPAKTDVDSLRCEY